MESIARHDEVTIGDETFPVVRTDDPAADFGRAAVRNPDGTISGVHVTDDPERAGRAVRAGRLVDGGGPEKYGDLGPGLYMSNAPHLWVARAHGKWSFLDGMRARDRVKLSAELRTSLATTRWLSETERDYAHTVIEDFVESGHPHGVLALGEQPYVIGFWKPEYLARLGIEPGPQPKQVPVKLRGQFAESSRGLLTPDVCDQLKVHGVDGAFAKGAMAYPQLVVWNPEPSSSSARPSRCPNCRRRSPTGLAPPAASAPPPSPSARRRTQDWIYSDRHPSAGCPAGPATPRAGR